MFDLEAPVICIPHSLILHTSNASSDPFIQQHKLCFHCAEFWTKIVNCASNHPIQFFDYCFAQIIGSRSDFFDLLSKFLHGFRSHLN